MDLEAGFEKETYFLKKITGREILPDIDDNDRAELSGLLKSYSKQNIDKVIASMDPIKLAGLKGDTRNLITSFVNLKEYAIAQDKEAARKEKERQAHILEGIRDRIKTIKDKALKECVALGLCVVNQCHGRALGAEEEDIEEANRALMSVCFGIGGVILLGTVFAALTVGLPAGIIVLGVSVGIGAIALAIYDKYKSIKKCIAV